MAFSGDSQIVVQREREREVRTVMSNGFVTTMGNVSHGNLRSVMDGSNRWVGA